MLNMLVVCVWKGIQSGFERRIGALWWTVQRVRMLWAGVGAQLARDVPFSAICWTTLEPVSSSSLCFVEQSFNA
jgi:solute carrier family 25 protein 39/40